VSDYREILPLIEPTDACQLLKGWVRTERQRLVWTQAELARRSGVPAATISRLEQTGLASTDTLFKILFALNKLDGLAEFLKVRMRLASVPMTLEEPPRDHPVLRVRHKKEGI